MEEKNLFTPEFVPFYVEDVRKFNLTLTEGLVYGFIRYYTKLDNNGFYFKSEQLAEILKTTPATIDNTISKLKNKGIICTETKNIGYKRIRLVFICDCENIKNNKEMPKQSNLTNQLEPNLTNQLEPNLTNQLDKREYLNNNNKNNSSSIENFENQNQEQQKKENTKTTTTKKIKNYSEDNKKLLQEVIDKIETKESIRFIFYSHCIKRYTILKGKININLLEERIIELAKKIQNNKLFLNELLKMIDYYYESGKDIKLLVNVINNWFEKFLNRIENE